MTTNPINNNEYKKMTTNPINIIDNNEIFFNNDENKNINNLHNKQSDVLCVTTFNKKLYNDYAHKFIESYNLPFDLIIYSEDDLSFLKNDIKYNVTILNSTIYIPEMNDFINKNLGSNEENKKKFGKKLYKGDAIRFCYKVFAVTHAGLTFKNYKYLIWLDADIIFKNQLTINIIENDFINNNIMMSYFGRKNTYSECGVLFFNLTHEYINKYFREVLLIYITNNIFNLIEYHDCYAWDYVRSKFEHIYNVKCFSISKIISVSHIIETTKLSNYIIHNKGKLKYK